MISGIQNNILESSYGVVMVFVKHLPTDFSKEA